jgi:hypothetical protein
LNELVHFSADGLHHLLFKNRRKRTPKERKYRLSLLKYVHEVISNSISAELVVKSENPLVLTWAISYRIIKKDGSVRTLKVVVIKKKPKGRLYFLSVMDA